MRLKGSYPIYLHEEISYRPILHLAGVDPYYAQAETDTEFRDAALRQAEATVAAGALSEDELEQLKQDLLTDPTPDRDNDHGL